MSLVVLQDIYSILVVLGLYPWCCLIGRVCPWWCYRIFIFLVVLGL